MMNLENFIFYKPREDSLTKPVLKPYPKHNKTHVKLYFSSGKDAKRNDSMDPILACIAAVLSLDTHVNFTRWRGDAVV